MSNLHLKEKINLLHDDITGIEYLVINYYYTMHLITRITIYIYVCTGKTRSLITYWQHIAIYLLFVVPGYLYEFWTQTDSSTKRATE